VLITCLAPNPKGLHSYGHRTRARPDIAVGFEVAVVLPRIGQSSAVDHFFGPGLIARKYELAIQQGRNTEELDANFAAAHLLLGENYVQVGMHEQGFDELQTAASLSGNSPLYLAQVAVAHATAGRMTEALQIVAQLQSISSTQYVSPYGLAQIFAAMNDKEQTFKWLQIAYDDRAVWMSYLAVDPVFDSLRSDQRFQDLLRRVRLLP
jgi:hypothetical protein